MSTYIDTSAFLAVLSENDRFHQEARIAWEDLLTQEEPLTCNNYVLVETFALIQSRFGMQAVRIFQSDVIPILNIFWVDKEIHLRAESSLIIANRRGLSLVDCSSFETMRKLGIRRTFAFDSHFEELGFETIPTL